MNEEKEVTVTEPEIKNIRTANDFSVEIEKLIHTAGTLELTKEQSNELTKVFPEEKILIRPDGLVYYPWTEYAKRMNDVFGPAGWAMIPQGMPQMANNLIVWGFHLIVKGKYIEFAIGEQKFFPKNATMTYGDACEGAKSNTLSLLCKRLGIGIELWNKEYGDTWKSKYAEQVEVTGYNGTKQRIWRKKLTSNN